MEIPDQLEQFRIARKAADEMLETLGKDCKEHWDAVQKDASQVHRRAYVRAVFAFIEGLIHCQKMFASNLGILFGAVTLYELVALEDANLEIDGKGNVTMRPAFPKFLNNLQFAFKVYSKSIGSDFQLSLGGVGWESLKKAVKIRDRLMHPKEPIELVVSSGEVRTTRNAFDWFFFSYSLCSLYAEKALCLKSGDNAGTGRIVKQISKIEAELT